MLGLPLPFLRTSPDAAWRLCYRAEAVLLVDGSTASGQLMSRRIRGVWQYRAITPQEAREWALEQTW